MNGFQRPARRVRAIAATAGVLLAVTGCHNSKKQAGGGAGESLPPVKAAGTPTAPQAKQARWRLAFVGRGSTVSGVANDGAGHWVVADSNGVETWSVRNGQPLAKAPLRASGECLAARPGGKQMALGDSTGQVRLISMQGKPPVEYPKLSSYVVDVAFDAKGAHLAAVSQDGVLHVYDVTTGKTVHTAKSPEKSERYSAAFHAVAFHPGGRILVVGGVQQIHLFDVGKGAFIRSVAGPGPHISSLSFSNTGSRLAAAGPKQAWVFDTNTWQPVKKIPAGRAPVAFGPKGKWLAMAGAKRQLVLYSLPAYRVVARFDHADSPWRLAFASDGRGLLLLTKPDRTVYAYRYDNRPDIGVRIAALQWIDEDGPTLYATLSVVGTAPRDAVAYGRLSGLAAKVAGSGAKARVAASEVLTKGMIPRNRKSPVTTPHGFSLNLKVHGIPSGAKRLARLEGSFVMRVARKSKQVRFAPLAKVFGKPLSHPVLKTVGLQVRTARDKESGGIQVTYRGQLGQLESVSLLDPKGKPLICSEGRMYPNLPEWTCPAGEKSQASWTLALWVNTKTQLLRGRFALADVRLPPRKK